MSLVEHPNTAGLIARVQNILLKPKSEWEVIDAESATPVGLYLGYACILAAIPPIARLIGGQVFGYGAFLIHFHPPLLSSIASAIVGYVLGLASIFVFALVIDALAPSFDGRKDSTQALKVAIYASTASWIGGVFSLVPALALISALFGFYSLYLLYLGIPVLMKAPQEKSLTYTIVAIVAAVAIYLVVGLVMGVVASVTGVISGAGLGGMGVY